ncbi:hypothetical protein FKB34_14580 [Glycocaulis profundi]|nr:hypothetical protein FKB34_14580 [Glycocaulis profundi]
MTGAANKTSNNSASDGEENHVALWKVLARLRSKDLDEGLSSNQAVIQSIRQKHVWHYRASLFFAVICALIFGFSMLGAVFSAGSGLSKYFLYCANVSVLGFGAPFIWRWLSQYGPNTNMDDPKKLAHERDDLFDKAIKYLQKIESPEVYYFSSFRNKKVCLGRKQFFGKLRYFLFSEHSDDRAMVMRFPSMFGLSADVYLHRDDVEKMHKALKPPKKSSRLDWAGRTPTQRYTVACLDLIADPRMRELDLNRKAATTETLTDWLSDWFKKRLDGTEMDPPKRDSLEPYAEILFEQLNKPASEIGR